MHDTIGIHYSVCHESNRMETRWTVDEFHKTSCFRSYVKEEVLFSGENYFCSRFQRSNARSTSSGTAKTIVFDSSDETSLMVVRVRRWSAPGDEASISAAFLRFSAAPSSPSDLM